MADRCKACGQEIPAVAHCVCGHTRAEHSIREHRRKVLTRSKCFVLDCTCQKYTPIQEAKP